ncbi:MAG: ribosomal protein L7/L12 [Erythrobacter sp.]
MFVPLPFLALAVVALILLALVARRRGGGDMIERQRRDTPTIPVDADKVLADPDVAAAISANRKIEAIKLVRLKTGLGLKEAKDLVERS